MLIRSFIKSVFLLSIILTSSFSQGLVNFLNHWIGIESLETSSLTYDNRNISIIIEEGGERDGYYIYNSSSDFLYNEDLDWAYHYFTFSKDRFDQIIFLRRFMTPMGVLGYEELVYDLIEWSFDFFVAEYVSDDGQSIHQIRMNANILDIGYIKPVSFQLKQNYPNPFNPQTTIEILNYKNQYGSLKIYDLNGELVRQLFNGELKVGKNQYLWKGENDFGEMVSAGTYLYKLEVENSVLQIQKMTYLK